MGRTATAWVLGLLLLSTTPAWGEFDGSILLRAGELAPVTGVFYAGPALDRLTEALRDRENWKAQLDTLRAQVKALEDALAAEQHENIALKEALDAQKIIVAKAEFIDQHWERIMGRYEELIKRLDARITTLEWQRALSMVLGPLMLLFGLWILP